MMIQLCTNYKGLISLRGLIVGTSEASERGSGSECSKGIRLYC